MKTLFLAILFQSVIALALPEEGVRLNGIDFLIRLDTESGQGLWRSDGTPQGTYLVKDLPGAHPYAYKIRKVASKIYVLESGAGTSPYNVWKSDGTAAGTIKMAAIPANAGAVNSDPDLFEAVNGRLIIAQMGQLWSSDSNSNSFVKICEQCFGAGFTHLFKDRLYFDSNNSSGLDLFVTDATESGTHLVKHLGVDASNESYFLDQYFTYSDSDGEGFTFILTREGRRNDTRNDEVWHSNGSEAATQRIVNINEIHQDGRIIDLKVFKNSLWFITSSNYEIMLWKYDKSLGSATVIKQIAGNRDAGHYSAEMSVAGDELFFNGFDFVNGVELWKTDGTNIGSRIVKDICVGPENSSPSKGISVNGKYIFSAHDNTFIPGLWVTDGSESSTKLLGTFGSTDSGDPAFKFDYPEIMENQAYFSVSEGLHETSLFKTNGTVEGTIKVASLGYSKSPGYFRFLYTDHESKLIYFTYQRLDYTTHEIIPQELWVTNGTTEGTRLLAK